MSKTKQKQPATADEYQHISVAVLSHFCRGFIADLSQSVTFIAVPDPFQYRCSTVAALSLALQQVADYYLVRGNQTKLNTDSGDCLSKPIHLPLSQGQIGSVTSAADSWKI